MTKQEIIEEIRKACDKYKHLSYSEFFCGMTNNVSRRKKEHGVDEIEYDVCLKKKEYANDLLTELSKLGFDTTYQIGNGQDDSLWLYAYQKNFLTTEVLSGVFDLEFEKRWYNENDYDDAPNSEGIYICIACDKETKDGKDQPHDLVYIGMTEKQGFKERIGQHIAKDHDSWKKYIDTRKEQLVYAIAPKNSQLLQTIESALIYTNQPVANSEYRDHYQGEYAEVTVNCNGYHGGKVKKTVTTRFKE